MPAPITLTPAQSAANQAIAAGGFKASDVLGTTTPAAAPANPVFDPTLFGQAPAGATGTESGDLDAANSADAAAKETPATPNTTDMNTAANQFQSEIDGLNQVYAQQKAAATTAGLNEIGGNTAMEARRGLLGSDFGAADANNTLADVNAKQAAIDAKHSSDLGAVYTNINSAANGIAANRVKALQSGADATVANIKGRQDEITAAVGSAVKAYFAAGNDGSKLTQADINAWAQQLKTTPDVILNAVKDAKTAAVTAQQAADKAKKDSSTTLNPGQTEVGADGNIIAAAPEDPIDQALKQAQIRMDNATTAKTTADIANGTLTPQNASAVNSAQTRLADNVQVKAFSELASANSIVQSIPDGTTDPTQQSVLIAETAHALSPGSTSLRGALSAISPGTLQSGVYNTLNDISKIFDAKGTLSPDAVNQLKTIVQSLYSTQAPIYKQIRDAAVTSLTNRGITGADGYIDNYLTSSGSTSSSAASSPAKGTDGAQYGYPGYVSDGTQWVKKP